VLSLALPTAVALRQAEGQVLLRPPLEPHAVHTLPGLQAAIPGAFSEAKMTRISVHSRALDLVQKWVRNLKPEGRTVNKHWQGATGQSADKVGARGVTGEGHRRALTVRVQSDRDTCQWRRTPRAHSALIDVDPIIQVQVANTQISTRRYGSDPTRTELNPVRSMLEGIMMQPDLLL
jgi:hypothetical protein